MSMIFKVCLKKKKTNKSPVAETFYFTNLITFVNKSPKIQNPKNNIVGI